MSDMTAVKIAECDRLRCKTGNIAQRKNTHGEPSSLSKISYTIIIYIIYEIGEKVNTKRDTKYKEREKET